MKMAADQFCLRWNNFQVNITSALESLKCDEDLVDVTLTCDGQNVKAHKVILSACSPYFRSVFRENPCQHPVVILKDVSYEDVTALLNFMYQGEVYITQDRLAPFLHTAELLQVRGLAGATNPFKESQSPSQQQQHHHQPQPQQKQHQQKPKKQVSAPAGQLKRVTPPLSISPSSIPIQTPSKSLPYSPSYRTSKSPIVSPTSKDSHTTGISTYHVKEKPVAQHLFPPNRDPDAGHLKSSLGQSNMSATLLPTSSNYATGSEQSSSSYQSAISDQQSYSASQHPSQLHQTLSNATYQQHSNEPSPIASHQFPSAPHDEQSSSQPSSPQPMSAKRRKAFPRRLSSSSCHAPTDEPALVSDGSNERPKASSRSGEEQPTFEVVKVVPGSVKQEPIDEEDQEGEAQEEMDMTSRQSADSEDMEVTGFYNHPEVDSENPIPLEQSVKEENTTEGTAEGSSEISQHSMLLRSLAGVQVQQTDDIDFHCLATSSNEAFLLPPWDVNNTLNSELFPTATNWGTVKNRTRLNDKSVTEGKPLVTTDGLQISHVKADSLAAPVMSSGQVQVTAGVNPDYMTSSSYSTVAARLASRTLYQKRKHVWRSRRPVQCPNCQKVITMAYNLKSHLVTCLKRNGGLYRKT